MLPHLKAGGAERVVSFMFMKMDKEVYDLNLLVLGSKKDNHYNVGDQNVYYLNNKRLRFSFIEIIKFLRKNKPDIVFSSIGHINLYFGFIKKGECIRIVSIGCSAKSFYVVTHRGGAYGKSRIFPFY